MPPPLTQATVGIVTVSLNNSFTVIRQRRDAINPIVVIIHGLAWSTAATDQGQRFVHLGAIDITASQDRCRCAHNCTRRRNIREDYRGERCIGVGADRASDIDRARQGHGVAADLGPSDTRPAAT